MTQFVWFPNYLFEHGQYQSMREPDDEQAAMTFTGVANTVCKYFGIGTTCQKALFSEVSLYFWCLSKLILMFITENIAESLQE